MNFDEISFGPVLITGGPHEGRIGYYDDEDVISRTEMPWDLYPKLDRRRRCPVGIVYFGDFFIAERHYKIPECYLRHVTISDLFARRDQLIADISPLRNKYRLELVVEERLDLLAELHYVENTLVDRLVEARYVKVASGVRVFVSHSSKNKVFARTLVGDLKAAGLNPWFDEAEITVGESIPNRLAAGLEDTDFVVVLLSKDAVQSKWVEREWHERYWDEVESGRVVVLPALIEDCEIPTFLRTKKYADFRFSFNDGLEDLLLAIKRYSEANSD